MNLEVFYVHLKNLMWFPVDEEATWIVCDMEENKFFRMQKDGKRIYELLDGSRSVSDIIALICEEDNVDKEKTTKEITEFLENMLEIGLILPLDNVQEV